MDVNWLNMLKQIVHVEHKFQNLVRRTSQGQREVLCSEIPGASQLFMYIYIIQLYYYYYIYMYYIYLVIDVN